MHINKGMEVLVFVLNPIAVAEVHRRIIMFTEKQMYAFIYM